MDLIQLSQNGASVVWFCENATEHCFHTRQELFDQVSDYQILKKEPCSARSVIMKCKVTCGWSHTKQAQIKHTVQTESEAQSSFASTEPQQPRHEPITFRI